ncbi:elastase-1-like [Clupea harengus]|uniref:pancreatic elastase n=1 Tax=Clupea harengus TaxID=7950 RepID=A0A6P8G533_CLUHA|nr:elastase-1-like [Clupea harengus]
MATDAVTHTPPDGAVESLPPPLALALAEPDSEPIPLRVVVKKRVVGGSVARPHYWPWQVSLQYRSRGSSYHHTCGGTLVSRDWVMTAAHCVNRCRTWRVVLGEYDLNCNSRKEQILGVTRVYIHPKWNSKKLANGYDIALLRLSSKAQLNSDVRLATLPPPGQVLGHKHVCYITGWGRTSTKGRLSTLLKQAYLPIVGHSTCSCPSWWGRTVKNTMLCAGGGSNSGCNGDSGGPLNCWVNGKYVVHGITSFGSRHGCNIRQRPTVFTRVSAFLCWMKRVRAGIQHARDVRENGATKREF